MRTGQDNDNIEIIKSSKTYLITVMIAEDFEKSLCYSCAISKDFAELLSRNFQYLFSQSHHNLITISS